MARPQVGGCLRPRGEALIVDAFPSFAGRACPFGVDWLGRQFALDARRAESGEQLVLLLEPGTGEVLELPFSLADFHGQLIDLREPALAAGFFSDWARANPASLPLDVTDCVGYRVPLFLGGKDTLDNLEVIGLEVYWSLCASFVGAQCVCRSALRGARSPSTTDGGR